MLHHLTTSSLANQRILLLRVLSDQQDFLFYRKRHSNELEFRSARRTRHDGNRLQAVFRRAASLHLFSVQRAIISIHLFSETPLHSTQAANVYMCNSEIIPLVLPRERLEQELKERRVFFQESDSREMLVHTLEMDILFRSQRLYSLLQVIHRSQGLLSGLWCASRDGV